MSTEPTPPLKRKQIIALERATAESAHATAEVPTATLATEPEPNRPAPTPDAPTGIEPNPAPSGINATSTVGPAEPSTTERRRRLPAPLRWIFSALVIVVLCASILIGLAAIVIPAVGGGTALTVQTSSMEPHYPAGTMVIIRPARADDIAPRDVITYQLKSGQDAVVTHRVTQQLRTADGGYLFITQGDANPSADPEPIQPVQIRGKLWYAIPWVGWIANATNGPWRSAVIPLAVGALFAYAAWMFVSSARDKRRQRAPGAAA